MAASSATHASRNDSRAGSGLTPATDLHDEFVRALEALLAGQWLLGRVVVEIDGEPGEEYNVGALWENRRRFLL